VYPLGKTSYNCATAPLLGASDSKGLTTILPITGREINSKAKYAAAYRCAVMAKVWRNSIVGGSRQSRSEGERNGYVVESNGRPLFCDIPNYLTGDPPLYATVGTFGWLYCKILWLLISRVCLLCWIAWGLLVFLGIALYTNKTH
jgi:hypothetical protein